MTGRGNPPNGQKLNTEARRRRGNLLLFLSPVLFAGFRLLNMKDTSKKFFTVLSVDILTPRRCFASVLRHTIK